MPSCTKSRSGNSGQGLENLLSATSGSRGLKKAAFMVLLAIEADIEVDFRRPKPRQG
jgi:hypothetical protein